jgi:hypothetical protein
MFGGLISFDKTPEFSTKYLPAEKQESFTDTYFTRQVDSRAITALYDGHAHAKG